MANVVLADAVDGADVPDARGNLADGYSNSVGDQFGVAHIGHDALVVEAVV